MYNSYKWVISHMNQSCHKWMSLANRCHPMWWMSHVTHLNFSLHFKLCHTCVIWGANDLKNSGRGHREPRVCLQSPPSPFPPSQKEKVKEGIEHLVFWDCSFFFPPHQKQWKRASRAQCLPLVMFFRSRRLWLKTAAKLCTRISIIMVCMCMYIYSNVCVYVCVCVGVWLPVVMFFLEPFAVTKSSGQIVH